MSCGSLSLTLAVCRVAELELAVAHCGSRFLFLNIRHKTSHTQTIICFEHACHILYCETHCDTSNMGVLGVIDDRCHRDSKSGLVESPLLQPPESEFCSLELRLIH